jgi:hypothetical protein
MGWWCDELSFRITFHLNSDFGVVLNFSFSFSCFLSGDGFSGGRVFIMFCSVCVGLVGLGMFWRDIWVWVWLFSGLVWVATFWCSAGSFGFG